MLSTLDIIEKDFPARYRQNVMTVAQIKQQALALKPQQRLRLVQDIWDSIAAFPEAIPLTDAQKEELDRRLQAYATNPNEGISWDELKDKLRKSA